MLVLAQPGPPKMRSSSSPNPSRAIMNRGTFVILMPSGVNISMDPRASGAAGFTVDTSHAGGVGETFAAGLEALPMAIAAAGLAAAGVDGPRTASGEAEVGEAAAGACPLPAHAAKTTQPAAIKILPTPRRALPVSIVTKPQFEQ